MALMVSERYFRFMKLFDARKCAIVISITLSSALTMGYLADWDVSRMVGMGIASFIGSAVMMLIITILEYRKS